MIRINCLIKKITEAPFPTSKIMWLMVRIDSLVWNTLIEALCRTTPSPDDCGRRLATNSFTSRLCPSTCRLWNSKKPSCACLSLSVSSQGTEPWDRSSGWTDSELTLWASSLYGKSSAYLRCMLWDTVLNKELFTSDRELRADQSKDTTKVNLKNQCVLIKVAYKTRNDS